MPLLTSRIIHPIVINYKKGGRACRETECAARRVPNKPPEHQNTRNTTQELRIEREEKEKV